MAIEIYSGFSSNSYMKKALAGFALCAAATTAMAWGPREQGLLAGIAGTLIIQQIFKGEGQAQTQNPPPATQPPVVVYQRVEPIIIYQTPLPPLRVQPFCIYHPFHLPDGRLIGYTKSCH